MKLSHIFFTTDQLEVDLFSSAKNEKLVHFYHFRYMKLCKLFFNECFNEGEIFIEMRETRLIKSATNNDHQSCKIYEKR